MSRNADTLRPPLRWSVLIIVVVLIAAAVFAVTLVSIRNSRSDSLRLLQEQGVAFTEALALACENTITASAYYDRLVEEHYADLAATLNDDQLDAITSDTLLAFVQMFNLLGAYVVSVDSELISGAGLRSMRAQPPDWVLEEAYQLIAEPEKRYVLLVDQEELTGETIHYYVGLTSRLDRVVILATYARYHTEAYRRTGIGFLVQNMAKEKGVEYIIYQATDGIIFASRKPGPLLSIDSDPFLATALQADTVSSRIYAFQDQNVLELVRPFATQQYPIGLFRVGLSLEGFYSISRGFDQRMVLLAVVLFGFLLAVVLYVNSRRRGRELSRQYSQIKSLTDKLFDEMRTGVAAVNADGTVIFANEAFVRIFGGHDCVGKAYAEVVADPAVAFDAFMESGLEAAETEITVAANGDQQVLLVGRSRVELEDRAGRRAMVVVVYDVTRLKDFERQSMRRERLSELGNLAAGVAHEIRNPLNTISIAAQRLAAEFTPAERETDYRAFTQTIREETRRLNGIITRFLALARDDRRATASVDLTSAIHAAADLVRPEADGLGITIEVAVDRDMVVPGDADLIKQILLNLYNNAKEALNGAPGEVRISARRDGDHAVLVVADSGPGIPVPLREKVLAPYFTTKEAGTGLGLPTVHKIISDLGGDLAIEQSDRGGAAIRIRLPLQP